MTLPGQIALGTAQFGLPYGIANQGGQISHDEAARILGRAWAAGVDMLDTAVAYGDSESRLGNIGVEKWHVISKIPPVPDECSDIETWMQETVTSLMKRLKTDQLYGLLLHDPSQLSQDIGDEIYQALLAIKKQGAISKIGISIYNPDELPPICHRFEIDIVQAPLNIIDRRLIDSGWATALHDRGIEVHARSIFLQGLLLMQQDQRHPYFRQWDGLWTAWQNWLHESDLTPVQACIGFAIAQAGVDRVIVGIDSLAQLEDILENTDTPIDDIPPGIGSDDIDLVNPSRWKLN